LIYVDDIIIASNDQKKVEVIKDKLTKTFQMTDMGNLIQFLGINIRRSEDGIYLSQRSYLTNQQHYKSTILQCFGMNDCKESKTPIDVIAKTNESKDTEVHQKLNLYVN